MFDPNLEIQFKAEDETRKLADFRTTTVNYQVVDTQVNGIYANRKIIDFSSPIDLDDLSLYCEAMKQQGVHYTVPTIITATKEVYEHNCAVIAQGMKKEWGQGILGIHLEGPYLDEANNGAHPKQLIRRPDLEEFDSIMKAAEGNIILVTTAPVYDNSQEFIHKLVSERIVVSIGHHSANYEQIKLALDAGATGVTHFGNAMRGNAERIKGNADAYLMFSDPRLRVMFVADGEHVPSDLINAAYIVRGFTDPSSVLITSDGSPLSRAPIGEYNVFGGQKFSVGPSQTTNYLRTYELSGSYLSLPEMIDWLVQGGTMPAHYALRASGPNVLDLLLPALERNGRMENLRRSGHDSKSLLRMLYPNS